MSCNSRWVGYAGEELVSGVTANTRDISSGGLVQEPALCGHRVHAVGVVTRLRAWLP